MVRQMNRLIARRAPEPSPQAAPPAEPATTPEEIELLREIRDSLKRFG
jgi:large conductance mechanosensitive channel